MTLVTDKLGPAQVKSLQSMTFNNIDAASVLADFNLWRTTIQPNAVVDHIDFISPTTQPNSNVLVQSFSGATQGAVEGSYNSWRGSNSTYVVYRTSWFFATGPLYYIVIEYNSTPLNNPAAYQMIVFYYLNY